MNYAVPAESPPHQKELCLMCVKTDPCFCLVRELKTFSHWGDFFGEIAAKTTDDRRRECERIRRCV